MVPFILPDDFLRKLANLRHDYEKLTGTNLSEDSQRNLFFCAMGSKNIKERHKQISLIEKALKALFSPFFETNAQLNLSTEAEVNAYFEGLRVLMAVVFYIKSEISDVYWVRSATNSTLFKLLDDALGLPKGNVIDQETRQCVLKITQEYIKRTSPKLYQLRDPSKVDQNLDTLLSDPQWIKLEEFINQQLALLDKPTQTYPITATLMPALAAAGYYTGLPVGFFLGGTFARSTVMLPTRAALTTAVGTVLLVLAGPTGGSSVSIGLMLVAPPTAGFLLEAFCGISFAAALGNSMRLLGKGAGWAVGMSLDMTYKLACYALASLYGQSEQHMPPISGFNLVNGDYYIAGQKISTIENPDELQRRLSATRAIKIEPQKEGIMITVGDDNQDQALIPYDPEQLPQEQQLILKRLEEAMMTQGLLPTAEQKLKAEEPHAEPKLMA